MKLLILALSVLTASAALADGGAGFTTKINSFTHLGDNTSTLAELCGSVTVTNTDMMPAIANVIPVTITADPNTNNPGVYTVLADRVGNFCALINTYSGTAQAEAWLPGGTTPSMTSVAHVTPARHR